MSPRDRWTAERAANETLALGTSQLVLLGRWLQSRGYAFWSLGHCYSPQMEYKRQLGHRVYPREAFLALLRQHRGEWAEGGGHAGHAVPNGGGGASHESADDAGAAGRCAAAAAPQHAPLVAGDSCLSDALICSR